MPSGMVFIFYHNKPFSNGQNCFFMHIIDLRTIIVKFIDVVFVYHMKNKEEIKWHSRFHHHGQDEYELHYFINGTGKFLNNKNIYRINSGSFFITSPKCDHSI
ncbi:MAG: AraC family ligand binding domain-containing protein, partial [Spirochaetaceae bacterium]|nr:AraC family ligand binding domain-containing protein [Spirochaetaceae bacterium]